MVAAGDRGEVESVRIVGMSEVALEVEERVLICGSFAPVGDGVSEDSGLGLDFDADGEGAGFTDDGVGVGGEGSAVAEARPDSFDGLGGIIGI